MLHQTSKEFSTYESKKPKNLKKRKCLVNINFPVYANSCWHHYTKIAYTGTNTAGEVQQKANVLAIGNI